MFEVLPAASFDQLNVWVFLVATAEVLVCRRRGGFRCVESASASVDDIPDGISHGGIGRLLFRVFDVVINLKEGTMADSKYTLAIICHTYIFFVT